MLDKYFYAIGRGVRGIREALDEQRRAETPDPAISARDVTPPRDAPPQPVSIERQVARADGNADGNVAPLQRKKIEIGKRVLVMGIVNVTPDSFSDGGHFFDPDRAIAHALQLDADGADILDIGGESTRPGAAPVTAEEEIARVVPIIRAIASQTATPISIDTMKASVATAALAAGASMVNDVWGFRHDTGIAGVVARAGVPCVLMHNRREVDPVIDIYSDVCAFLSSSIDLALRAGVKREDIVVDPGIGFGKTNEQSMEMVRRLAELKAAFGLPLLLGLSRKRMIGEATGRKVAAQRDAGTVAANLFGIGKGADIVRVHNVTVHVDALRVMAALENNVSDTK